MDSNPSFVSGDGSICSSTPPDVLLGGGTMLWYSSPLFFQSPATQQLCFFPGSTLYLLSHCSSPVLGSGGSARTVLPLSDSRTAPQVNKFAGSSGIKASEGLWKGKKRVLLYCNVTVQVLGLCLAFSLFPKVACFPMELWLPLLVFLWLFIGGLLHTVRDHCGKHRFRVPVVSHGEVKTICLQLC